MSTPIVQNFAPTAEFLVTLFILIEKNYVKQVHAHEAYTPAFSTFDVLFRRFSRLGDQFLTSSGRLAEPFE